MSVRGAVEVQFAPLPNIEKLKGLLHCRASDIKLRVILNVQSDSMLTVKSKIFSSFGNVLRSNHCKSTLLETVINNRVTIQVRRNFVQANNIM